MKNPKIKCAKDGCKSWAMHDNTFCRAHNPDLPPIISHPKIKCAKDGCKSGAMHDNTFCRVHHPDLTPNGFQPGNKIGNQFQPGKSNESARKHGFYAKYMTEEEEKFLREELEQPQEIGFEEIIALTKLGITRALKSGETDPLHKMISLLAKIKMMQIKASHENEGNELIASLDKVLTEMGLGG
jgi:hypothetical protein